MGLHARIIAGNNGQDISFHARDVDAKNQHRYGATARSTVGFLRKVDALVQLELFQLAPEMAAKERLELTLQT